MRNRRPRAFTLIELLVVVAIIALLIAILLPYLSRAREQSRRTATLGHLHAIGIAMATYSSEWDNRHSTDLADGNEDGRAFSGLALLAKLHSLPPKLFINTNTTDTPATAFNADGWPILADIGGVPITLTTPATIDSSNIASVKWHCSFSYDHERKRTGNIDQMRVYLGDRADYAQGRSFSANWAGAGMCVLYTDQHAEFIKTKSLPEQQDPNLYHHNEYDGEGATEVVNDVSVSPSTIDSHLRFFSEEEDDALLPSP